MKHSISKRLLALLLCLAMLLPYLDALSIWAWAEETGEDPKPHAVVVASSDFQYGSLVYNGVTYENKNLANAAMFRDVLEEIQEKYPVENGVQPVKEVMVGGDYEGGQVGDLALSSAGAVQAEQAIVDVFGQDCIARLVQGNHDPAETTGLDPTGGTVNQYYSVYQINEDDYPGGRNDADKATCRQSADGLISFLQERVAESYRLPVFVISHRPLHQSTRGDTPYARYFLDAMNDAAEQGLNIIYLFGHNHSNTFDAYLGKDRIYLEPGSKLLVSDPNGSNTSHFDEVSIHFTYLNTGYMGYMAGGGFMTATSFAIYDDHVEINRFDKDGVVALKAQGTASGLLGEFWWPDTTEISSPRNMPLLPFGISITAEPSRTLYQGEASTATLTVSGTADYEVRWSVEDPAVVSVAQNSAQPGTAVLTGTGFGTTVVHALVRDAEDAALSTQRSFPVTVVPRNAVCHSAGDGNLYRLVDWSEFDPKSNYMLLSTDQPTVATALGGKRPYSDNPALFLTHPSVFTLSGQEGVYAVSEEGRDVWSFAANKAGDGYALVNNETNNYIAVGYRINSAFAGDYACGYRMASSTGSTGSAYWRVDQENGGLHILTAYSSGAHNAMDNDYVLSYNAAEDYFQISLAESSSNSPIYLYENTYTKAPEIWLWTEGQGAVECGASADSSTGGVLKVMTDGVVTEVPITLGMLEGALPDLPGQRTCSVYYQGKLVTNDYSLTVNGENGPIEVHTLLDNNDGMLYKLQLSVLNGKPMVTVNSKTAGPAKMMYMALENGEYVLKAADVQVIETGNPEGVYVKVPMDACIWEPDIKSLGSYYLKNRIYGKYLTPASSGETLTFTDSSSVYWYMNTSRYTLTTHTDEERVLDYADGTYHVPVRSGVPENNGYVYVAEDQIASVIVYVPDQTASMEAGGSAITSGECIIYRVYKKDGTFEEQQIPITLSMLNMDYTQIYVPGTYECRVVYSGQVICSHFEVTVESSEVRPASKVTDISKDAKIYKLDTSFLVGRTYAFADTNVAGPAHVLTVTQGEDGTYVPGYALSAAVNFDAAGQFLLVRQETWEWLAADGAKGTTLYSSVANKHLVANADESLVLKDASSATIGWRRASSGYMATTQTSKLDGGSEVGAWDFIFSDRFRVAKRGTVIGAKSVYNYRENTTFAAILCYTDTIEGSCPTGSQLTVATGGNIIIKGIQTDGSVQTQSMPITLDMLVGVKALDLYVPGTLTCKVMYCDQVICDNYVLTVTAKDGEHISATRPVYLAMEDDKVYKMTTTFQPGYEYVFATKNTAGQGYAMTADGSGVVGVPVQIIADGTDLMVIPGNENAVWMPGYHTHDFSLFNQGAEKYLYTDLAGKLWLGDTVPTGWGWRMSSTNKYLGTSQTVADADTMPRHKTLIWGGTELGYYTATGADGAQGFGYLYQLATDVEFILAYLDQKEGSLAVGSTGNHRTGGNVIVSTVHSDGSTSAVIPIDLSMLRDISLEELVTAGTYTCSVWCGGKQITDQYQLTVFGDAPELVENLTTPDGQETVAVVDKLTSNAIACGSDGNTLTGSTVYVYTRDNSGLIRTEEIPVTVDMLTGFDPIDLYVPGDKTCTLMYDGKVLTDHYTLRLTAEGNEHPAVTKPVKLTDGTETVYQRTNQLVVGQSYVFVDTNTQGSAHMMAVTLQEDGTYAIEAIDVETIQGKNDVLVLARNDGVLWQFEENTNHYRIRSVTAQQYLHTNKKNKLWLSMDSHPDWGWRATSAYNIATSQTVNDDTVQPKNYELLYNDIEGFHAVPRKTANLGRVYYYVPADGVDMVLAYLDGNRGSYTFGDSGTIYPGGNVVVATVYGDGTQAMTVVPVDMSMLQGISLQDLTKNGTYTCSVWYDGKMITDNYQLTVTAEEPERICSAWPGDAQERILALDKAQSDLLPAGAQGRMLTGTTMYILTKHLDGSISVDSTPVLVEMVDADVTLRNTAGDHSGLNLNTDYGLILSDYTLRLEKTVYDDYPDFPNEGSVRVDKQMDTTKFNYLQTGSAQIDLSVAGIPITNKANVVIILDASSSMNLCIHDISILNVPDEATREVLERAIDPEATLSDADAEVLRALQFREAAVTYQGLIEERIAQTMSPNDYARLERGLSQFGWCDDYHLWVGREEGSCQTRETIIRKALADLLTYLGSDIEGYEMDIDVSVAYFNSLYPIGNGIAFKGQNELAITQRAIAELIQPFINSKEVDIQQVLAKYCLGSDTNYDRAMEWAYQLLAEKQTADHAEYLQSGDTMPYSPRESYVLFMSDGAPGQYNYMLRDTGIGDYFGKYCNGQLDADNLDQYVEPQILPIFKEMYHPEGKMWLAEAIKGDKTTQYKVIHPGKPESGYIDYVTGLDATLMTIAVSADASSMIRVATSEDYHIPTHTAEDMHAAFQAFGELVISGSGSYFKDQMGPEFDLQTANTIIPANVKDLYQPGSNSWDTFTGTKTTRTVYFDNYGSGWGTARVYAWDANGTPLTGNWPGTAMTHLGNGVFTYEVPAGAVNIQFNDGVDSRKTADLKMPANGGSLYDLSESKWVSYGTRTVYFDATGCSWSSVYAYTWGGSGISTTGNWPGAKMIDLGNGMYSCEIPADATGIKFSENGGSQTGNLTVQTNGKDLYRYSSGSWDTYVTRTVYFNNSGKNWSRVCAYTWDANGNYTTSPFPGMVMTHLGGNIYACQIPEDAQFMNFNDGSSSNQTADLNIPSTEIQLNSTITVSKYELYKYSEHLQDPEAVPMDLVGKRKDTPPTVLEQITFSDDGTQAYSNLIDGGRTNILIDGVICARNFWYNTSTGTTARIDIDGNGVADTNLESETFYWRVDNIPEDELVLTYNVYLTGTLEGTREEGSYPTNDYATLYYTNHLGHPCALDTTSPMLPWNQAAVGYAFYLVDGDGNPIVNENQHITGSFEKAVRLTQPQYIELLYNSDENVNPWVLNAADILPEGYSLYDPTISYHIALYANGDGSWQIRGNKPKATTYVTGYGGVPTTQLYATAGMSTDSQAYDYPAYATSSTVVWFAVRADVNAVPDTVVIDYGISVDIHVLGNDVVITDQNSLIAGMSNSCPADADGNGVVFTGSLADGFTGSYTGSFGNAVIHGTAIRYTPNTLQMTAEDRFYYSANYHGSKNAGYYYASVTVIPATSIYFEDNFVIFDEKWKPVGQTQSAVQDEDRVGSYNLPELDANNVYGYDSAYANMATWSLGSAMVARVSESDPEATAHFTFTGTGFDILSYCSSDTGAIIVDIFPGTEVTDTPYKSLMVDSYYQSEGSLYQVPIIKHEGLTYGTWTVQVYVGWSWWNAAGRPNYEWDDFYLDAIRVYDPANDGANSTVVKDAYVSDNEGWPSYQELRNMLITMQTFDALGEEDEVEGIIFIDGNAALDQGQIADYISFGPNNELYLAPGQAVAFNLNVNATDENTAAIHLGLKSVGGTAMAKVYNAAVNHTAVKAQTLSSASQQYYDITKLDGNTVVIANVGSDGDAILSVTDLKTTYKHEPKNTGRLTVTRTAAKQALASLMAEQPEPVLTPKYPTLSFESEVVYNVYFAAQNPVALEDMGLAIFDSTGTRLLERVPGAVASGELYMVSSNGINAKNLGDETYFKVYADLADGTTVYSGLYSYSARIYAENTLRSSSSSQTQKALAVAMLNYGAAAQTYFSYRTEELMNSGLTQEQKALCGTYSSEMVLPTIVPDSAKLGAELVATEGAFSGKRPTVTFGDRFTINYYFTPAQPVDGEVTLYYWDQSTYEAGQLTLENAQQTTMQLHSDGSYLAAGAPIAAKELNDTVFAMGVYTSGGVTQSTGVLPYSIAQYCHSNTSGSGARTALAEATVVYGHLAAQFFGNW